MPTAHMELMTSRPSACPEDELFHRIQSTTHRGIRDLEIDCTENRVKVTGISRSYYLKQLVTHAVLSVNPGVRLDNEIHVAFG